MRSDLEHEISGTVGRCMLHVVYVTSAVVLSRFSFVDDWNLSDFFWAAFNAVICLDYYMFTCNERRPAKNLDSLRGYMDFRKKWKCRRRGNAMYIGPHKSLLACFPCSAFPWVSTCGNCSNACNNLLSAFRSKGHPVESCSSYSKVRSVRTSPTNSTHRKTVSQLNARHGPLYRHRCQVTALRSSLGTF
jgi:hypothetical protein